jgi:hypothetical protein
MILETRTKRPQWLSLPHVPPVDFMCEPCRLISLLANEQAPCGTPPGGGAFAVAGRPTIYLDCSMAGDAEASAQHRAPVHADDLPVDPRPVVRC